ncbi:hypothetical protein WR25_03756 [Diploscapter pachys]|uniref:Uncharacterized protein n=1 Tax=Diploscapter pachys TaxID=2018661 RepID=A0A2A2LNI6_9BILA|nr:hypothetical protein WR25_03756 [Diploscapter pachys]
MDTRVIPNLPDINTTPIKVRLPANIIHHPASKYSSYNYRQGQGYASQLPSLTLPTTQSSSYQSYQAPLKAYQQQFVYNSPPAQTPPGYFTEGSSPGRIYVRPRISQETYTQRRPVQSQTQLRGPIPPPTYKTQKYRPYHEFKQKPMSNHQISYNTDEKKYAEMPPDVAIKELQAEMDENRYANQQNNNNRPSSVNSSYRKDPFAPYIQFKNNRITNVGKKGQTSHRTTVKPNISQDVNDYENFQVESRTLTPLKSSDDFIPISKNQQLVSDAFGPAAEMPDSVKDRIHVVEGDGNNAHYSDINAVELEASRQFFGDSRRKRKM